MMFRAIGKHLIRTSVRSLSQRNIPMTTKLQINQGAVTGSINHLPNGREFYAFKGVRYAVPPVGSLRFRDPLPLVSFDGGELNCVVEGNPSIHKDPYSAEMVGSEDCLFLNVYTNHVGNEGPKRAVLVWIHGGAFMFDSGSEKLYSPEHLLEKDVVVVTLNYRLGALGFLHMPQMGIRGNMGLKDQLLALKWVKENIASFGGDPDNICLFGESAGGASTHLHLLSPESRPYFHKAIMQSGTALMEWVMQTDSEFKTKTLASIIAKRELTTDEEIHATLMEADPVQIQTNVLGTMTAEERRGGLPMPFKPVVEQCGPGAIITKNPWHIINEMGEVEKPLMLGYTSHEGLIMLLGAVRKLNEYDSDLARLIPPTLNVKQYTPVANLVAAEMKRYFFQDKQVNKETTKELADIFSDFHFTLGTHWTAEIYSKMKPTHPCYMYRFSYDGELNLPKKLFGLGKYPGACHGDDMFYLFRMKDIDTAVEASSTSGQIREAMVRMWTNFAKYNNPTPTKDDLPFKWLPVNEGSGSWCEGEFKPNCLDIDTEIKMVNGPDWDRISFWRRLFKQYNGGFLNPKL